MILAEFEHLVVEAALASPICDIPLIRRLTATAINLRMELTVGGFVDVFYNEQTGSTAYAWIRQGRRVYGADNTGGSWHQHPFVDSTLHETISTAMSFADFLAKIDRLSMA
jgi:hypothetical protein